MLYMNDYDLEMAERRFDAAETMNRLRVARALCRYRDWVNSVSDGWPYWSPALRAAAKAMGLVESRTYMENEKQEEVDATDSEVTSALRPIKSFMTKHGGDWKAVLG